MTESERHDSDADEPLGPATPDEPTELGDTPEAHDEVTEHDLPKDHPGRPEVERRTHGSGGTTEGGGG